jgi:hypothetical protein
MTSIRDYLVLGLNTPFDYASTAWPAHYDANALRQLNTPPDNHIDTQFPRNARFSDPFKR